MVKTQKVGEQDVAQLKTNFHHRKVFGLMEPSPRFYLGNELFDSKGGNNVGKKVE